jgi:hypothetical protein
MEAAMLSQNGYPVLQTNRTTGALPRLRKWIIPGTNRHVFLRDGSAGFLLVHLALWFHERIEPIDRGTWDDWGWAVRPIRGQTTGYSNHAAGCAVDLNATLHPRGVSLATFKKIGQVALIRARLLFYRGVIGWGGDYQHSPIDGMHFEIRKNMTATERLARRLSTSPRGRQILAANPGAADVIWDGQVPPAVTKPAPTPKPKPVVKKPAPKPTAERLAVDYSYARPDPAAIKAAGYRGVIRYVSSKAAKNLTTTEADALRRAGLWIALVLEQSAQRASAGAAAGRIDAAFAEHQADLLGYPKDAVIFYAVDYDATAAQVADYFAGIRAAATRPVGVYGGFKVIEGIIVDHYWQTVAWSNGKVSGKANWLQRTSHSHNIKGSKLTDWDENLLIGGKVPVWPAHDKPVVP